MSKKYFGTDGIRGRVGEYPITPDFVMRLGYAAGKVLTSAKSNLAKGARPAVLIGKDTRISGYMLEAALEAGLISCRCRCATYWANADACSGLSYACLACAGGHCDFCLA